MSKDISRKGQHAALVDYFKEHTPSAKIIIDVGADQRKGSNSWTLIKSGWKGVLVEPVPRKVVKLHEDFVGDFVVIPVAVSDHFGKATLYMSEGDSYHSLEPDWMSELHTGSVLRVDTLTLPMLLLKCDVPHRFAVLDVDTEGHDPQVIIPMLEQTDWRPDVIIVELIDDKLYEALLACRYKFHRKFGVDSMWVYQQPTSD